MEAGEPGTKASGESGDSQQGKPPEPKATEKGAEHRWLLRSLVVAAAVIVGLVAWLATGDDGDDSPASESGVQTISEAELIERAAGVEFPIYWAGAKEGTALELSEVEGGGFQLRYLPEDGEASTEVLTVGTYPLPDPEAATKGFAGRPGSIVRKAGDREVVTSKEIPTSVYFASPDNSVQVEVYDPSPGRAMDVALSEQVRPVR